MAEYDDLRQILNELLFNKFSPKPSFTRGLLGDGNGNVTVPERPDKSYVRFNRGANEFFEVFNRTVNPVEDWPVLIGELPWQPGLTQVVDTDWSAFEQSGWGDNIGATSPHAPTHEWPDASPGSDPVNVYLRSIVPLRGYANNTGTSVFVNSYEYEYQGSGHVWGGVPSVDLSPVISSMPSGTMRLMGVYLDPATNLLGVVTGNTTVFTSAFDPPRVQFPANVIPSARVRVYGSQANVTEFDIRDARQPWGVANWWNAGGDLTGAYPNPQVSGLFGYPLQGGTPSEGDIWMFSGSVWRHLPFSGGGAGAWPGTGKAKIDETEYATWAAAIAAVGAGETIKLGDGTFSISSTTITTDCYIVGTGKGSTILTTTDAGCIATRANVTFENLTIQTTHSGTGQAIALAINDNSTDNGDVIAINCNFVANVDTPNGSRAVRIDAGGLHRLLECDGSVANADGTSTDDEALSLGDGSIEIRHGTWSGVDYDLQAYSTADTLILNDPIFANNLVVIDAAVSVGGKYLDNLYKLHRASTQELIVTSISSTSANDIMRVNSGSNSDFVATINSLPGGASVVYNAPSSGDAANLVPVSTSHLGKIVLHNTTRGDYALISNCNTGTSTITLTANVPGTWQVNDTITIRSQTNTLTTGGAYFVDIEFVTIDVDTQQFIPFGAILDTGAADIPVFLHPFEALSVPKLTGFRTQAAAVQFDTICGTIPLISSRFCILWRSSGTSTVTVYLRMNVEGKSIN